MIWGIKFLAVSAVALGLAANIWVWQLMSPKRISMVSEEYGPQVTIEEPLFLHKGEIKGTEKLEAYVYPGAEILSSDKNSYVLTANAKLDEVTDWYDRKFEERKIKDKSIIETDTNGDKVNMIIGNGISGETDVTIREEFEGVVMITVTNTEANGQVI